MTTGCTCAGISNTWNDGSECKVYTGYGDHWYDGEWCYANVDTCSDANNHPAQGNHNVPGYGASKAACGTGKYVHIS